MQNIFYAFNGSNNNQYNYIVTFTYYNYRSRQQQTIVGIIEAPLNIRKLIIIILNYVKIHQYKGWIMFDQLAECINRFPRPSIGN